MIEFTLDTRSGVSPYLQVVHQVRRALRLGLLVEGDQLPTVKDVVARLAINPNTVLKAYRELERDGVVHREVHDHVPPKVEYSLTEIGVSLDRALAPLGDWGERHLAHIVRCRSGPG